MKSIARAAFGLIVVGTNAMTSSSGDFIALSLRFAGSFVRMILCISCWRRSSSRLRLASSTSGAMRSIASGHVRTFKASS